MNQDSWVSPGLISPAARKNSENQSLSWDGDNQGSKKKDKKKSELLLAKQDKNGTKKKKDSGVSYERQVTNETPENKEINNGNENIENVVSPSQFSTRANDADRREWITLDKAQLYKPQSKYIVKIIIDENRIIFSR